MSEVFTIIFGLAGFVVAILLVIYLRLFLAKLFNHRVINTRGRVLYEPDSFDNLNAHLKEKISFGTQTLLKTSKDVITRFRGVLENEKNDKVSKLTQIQQLKANGTITEEEFLILKSEIFKN